jgi:uncharacterized RDD family membrane protein YckC
MSEAMHRCDGCETLFSEDQLVTIDGKRLCAQCKMGFVADVRSGLSGSGVELAGLGARFVAVFIDGLIMMIPVGAVTFGGAFLFAGAKSAETGVVAQPNFMFAIVLALIASIFPIVYEGLMLSKRGQTVGKRAMKIKVVMVDGSNITPGAAWKRALFRNIIGVISNNLLTIIDNLFIFGKGRRTLHDRVGGTIVIKAG